MIRYKTFISELRVLADQVPKLRKAKGMHTDPAFRQWRHELQSLFLQVGQAGYVLPGVIKAASRHFGADYDWGEEDEAFVGFQGDMDDTAIELRTIMKAFDRDGEPPREGSGNPASVNLAAPAKVTPAWLWHNVPANIWASGAVAIVTAFLLGYGAAKIEFFSKLVDLVSGQNSIPKQK